jgi:hypothetical protein
MGGDAEGPNSIGQGLAYQNGVARHFLSRGDGSLPAAWAQEVVTVKGVTSDRGAHKALGRFKGVLSLFGVLILTAIAGSCGLPPADTPEPSPLVPGDTGREIGSMATRTGKAPTEGAACPGVESLLHQALNSNQPLQVLEDLGYSVKEDKIQIVLTLTGENLSFLDQWDVEVGSQSGLQVQVFARAEDICEIARSDSVSFVRLPSLAVPQ